MFVKVFFIFYNTFDVFLAVYIIQFDTQKEFMGVWYALNTNIIEGWEPKNRMLKK